MHVAEDRHRPLENAWIGQRMVDPDIDHATVARGYGAWADKSAAATVQRRAAVACGCAHACAIHGHDHAAAWSGRVPTADFKGFWGALGCACWAV